MGNNASSPPPEEPLSESERAASVDGASQSSFQLPPDVEALIDAAEAGDGEAIDRWLASGHDINETAADGSTALTLCIRLDREMAALKLVATGVEHGLNLDAAGPEGSPLLMACQRGLFRLAAALVERGADVKARDATGASPLVLLADAPQDGSLELLISLLRAGAEPSVARNSDGFTALHLACERDWAAAVAPLVAAGCPVDHATNSGETALHAAARGLTNESALSAIVAASTKLDAAGGKNDSTPLHVAVQAHNLEAVRMLIAGGAQQMPDSQGRNPDEYIAEGTERHSEMLKLLQEPLPAALLEAQRVPMQQFMQIQSMFLHVSKELKTQKAEWEEERTALLANQHDALVSMRTLTEERDEARAALKRLESSLHTHRTGMDDMSTRNEELTAQLKKARENEAGLEKITVANDIAISRLQDSIREKNEELAKERAKFAHHEAEHAKELGAANSARQLTTMQLTAVRTELDTVRTEREHLSRELNELAALFDSLTNMSSRFTQWRDNLRSKASDDILAPRNDEAVRLSNIESHIVELTHATERIEKNLGNVQDDVQSMSMRVPSSTPRHSHRPKSPGRPMMEPLHSPPGALPGIVSPMRGGPPPSTVTYMPQQWAPQSLDHGVRATSPGGDPWIGSMPQYHRSPGRYR